MAKKKKVTRHKTQSNASQAEVYQDEANAEAPVINERAPAGSGIKHDKHAPKTASENPND